MQVFFLRHGQTKWNALKKFQGHTDIPLSEKGIAEVSTWIIPKRIEHWFVSPLCRARQTAEIHRLNPVTICDLLIEAFWGEWEGKVLKELRARDPQRIAEIEARGLDMRPPGGESPREVRARLSKWLYSISVDYQRIGVISHRGIIRAALSKATGWDMRSPHEINITHNCAYEFNWNGSELSYVAAKDLFRPGTV